jgi:integral membrane sensor domain MASE1
MRRVLVGGAQILVVAIAYYLAAKLGLRLAVVGEQVTPLWPPTGIALASLLLRGIGCWPGIAVGAFLANVTMGPSLPAVVAITAGNTLAPVCACLLLTRAGFRVDLKRLRDVLALIALAAFASTLISATVGSATLVVGGGVPAGDFWSTWSVWWTGDAMGVLVVAPVVFIVATGRRSWRAPPARWLEAVTLLVGGTALALAVTWSSANLLFLIFPMLIWAAVRFQHAGAVPCNLIVSVTVVLAAAAGRGPFAGLELLPTMITLQLFNGTATLTALVLAAITTERNEAQHLVQSTVSRMADAVRMLEPHRLLRDGLIQQAVGERDTVDQRNEPDVSRYATTDSAAVLAPERWTGPGAGVHRGR